MTNKNRIEISKGILIVLMCAVMLTPFMLHITDCKFNNKSLGGAYLVEKDTVLTPQSWFDGRFQERKNANLEHNFALHDYLVRLYNQIDFIVFKKAHSPGVVVGNDNYLYGTKYIEAYSGRDFIGEERITDYIRKLKQVQDSLEKKNKLLILILAPGKASFYPEFIPDKYKTNRSLSNYEALTEAAGKSGLNTIDFNRWFVSNKGKSKYPLYPKFGIHWSNYGGLLAFDSITKYIGAKLEVGMPLLNTDSIEVSDNLRPPDNDIMDGINLLWPPKGFTMAYPKISVKQDSTQKKLNLIVMSDSYWWQIYGTGLPSQIFANNQFWYYNEELYPDFTKVQLSVKSSDYYSRLQNADVMIILQTEASLSLLGNGFADRCYEVFCAPDKRNEQLQKMKEAILKTDDWRMQVIEKASKRGISLDSMVTLDALYMLNK